MNSLSGFLCRFRPLSILQHIQSNNLGARFLYSAASIGLDDYITSRTRYDRKWDVDADKFRKRMADICSGDESNLVFTEDLKLMLHIAKANEDIKLLEKMMHKFHSQTSALRFGVYSFGPVVMRMFHYLNKPEEALKVFKDEKLSGFFDQLSAHIVLMDMLFRNDMFEEVIEVHKIMRDKQLAFGRYPRSGMVLVFGSYYKLNTPEHYHEALKVYRTMIEAGNIPLRRAVCFLAALALNQNDPDMSLEIISTLPNQSYVLVRCVKALALCEIGKIDDAVSVLKVVLEYDKPDVMKHTFPYDVIEKVKASVDQKGDKQLLYNFNRVFGQLKEQGHLMDKTFNDLLCAEVQVTSPINRTQTVLQAAMDKSNDNHRKAFRSLQRPGLSEII